MSGMETRPTDIFRSSGIFRFRSTVYHPRQKCLRAPGIFHTRRPGFHTRQSPIPNADHSGLTPSPPSTAINRHSLSTSLLPFYHENTPPHPDPLPPLGGEGMIFMSGG
jgi:hypothetical protein